MDVAAEGAVRCARTPKSKTHGLGAFGAQRGAKRYLGHSEPARKRIGAKGPNASRRRRSQAGFLVPLEVPAFVIAMTAGGPKRKPYYAESQPVGADKFTPGVT